MILHAKNYQNQPMFYEIIPKIKVGQFLKTRCISVYVAKIYNESKTVQRTSALSLFKAFPTLSETVRSRL